jgi:hypothetical protein
VGEEGKIKNTKKVGCVQRTNPKNFKKESIENK